MHSEPSKAAKAGKRNERLADRIERALRAHGGRMLFHDLALELYPERRSHRYQSNGGPPGCYMALSAGVRRGGFPNYYDRDGCRYVLNREQNND